MGPNRHCLALLPRFPPLIPPTTVLSCGSNGAVRGHPGHQPTGRLREVTPPSPRAASSRPGAQARRPPTSQSPRAWVWPRFLLHLFQRAFHNSDSWVLPPGGSLTFPARDSLRISAQTLSALSLPSQAPRSCLQHHPDTSFPLGCELLLLKHCRFETELCANNRGR